MPADASSPLSRRAFLGMEGTLHISSLVVRARPDRLAAVVAGIGALPAAEVALTDPAGKIVVTLETVDEDEIVAAMGLIQDMAGVVNVALVYHQTEA